MTRVLVVEDDERLRTAMVLALRDEGYQVSSAVSLAEARVQVGDPRSGPEVLVLDVRLGPRDSGIDLVRELARESRLPPTIVVSGEATIGETVEALRLGVFDFLEKPVSRERLLQTLRNALEQQRLKRRVALLETRLDARRELLGTSPVLETLREQIARVAPTEARVLILGESGTGKELVAEQIHAKSARRDRPFVKLNCAAIPPTLIEAELFGHARGAFTDARTARAGLFEEADGGTLFLDEIGDMDLAMQARLLRVLEDGSVRRLGESQERRVDVRVLAATHRDVEATARDGRFRQDLYFRLAHVPLAVPALRDRATDVPLLFRHFVAAASARHRMRPKEIGEDVYPPLRAYAWPGNVRELRNVAERLVVLGSDPLRAEDLPADVFRKGAVEESGWLRTRRLTGGGIAAFKDFKTESEREYVEAVLQRCSWNVAAAARALGMPRTYLHAKVVALGIARPDRPLGGTE
jgi:two-component system nitrogen regulation response regulator NtrX